MASPIASQHVSDLHSADADYAEHERMYRNFLRILAWVVAGLAITLLLLAWGFG